MTSRPQYDVLTIAENDPERARLETDLRALDDACFEALFRRTRAAAAAHRATGDMEALIPLVRGLKTLHRLGAERGLIFRAAGR